MNIKSFGALLGGLLLIASPELATVYDVNLTTTGAEVSGSITTDSTIGTLHQSDITDWNLLASVGASSFDLTNSNSIESLSPPSTNVLMATVSGLFFSFSGGGTLEFIHSDPSGTSAVAFYDGQPQILLNASGSGATINERTLLWRSASPQSQSSPPGQ